MCVCMYMCYLLIYHYQDARMSATIVVQIVLITITTIYTQKYVNPTTQILSQRVRTRHDGLIRFFFLFCYSYFMYSCHLPVHTHTHVNIGKFTLLNNTIQYKYLTTTNRSFIDLGQYIYTFLWLLLLLVCYQIKL